MKIVTDHKKATIYEKIYFVVIFLMIYCSQDTLLFGTNANTNLTEAAKYLPFIFIIILLFLNTHLKVKNLLVVVLMCMLLMLTCFVNGEELRNYVYRCAILIAAFLLVEYNKSLFWEYYSKIMTFLCSWSIVTFVVNIIIPSIINIFPLIQNILGREYKTTFFSIISVETKYIVSRNQGIFREPGVFAVFLVIAMINELKCGSNINVKRFIIYMITMLTTMSTAGYIILTAICFYIISVRKEFKYIRTIIMIMSVVIICLVGFTDILQSDNIMWSKFQYGTNYYGSWFSRLSSLIVNIEIA